MRIFEITTESALVRSRIPGITYTINPYTGCEHGCRFCYATFMKKYSRHNRNTRWGDFVEVKTNIADVLARELGKKRKSGTAQLSSVCDPYQPLEKKYELTRQCLRLLRDYGWGADILTRSPLVVRDLDLLSSMLEATVGLSIGTDSDPVRRVLEPHAPSIQSRVDTLRTLHAAGISTWVFIAPMLPMNPEALHAMIAPHADRVLFDALNYSGQVRTLFKRHGWEEQLGASYAAKTRHALKKLFGDKAD